MLYNINIDQTFMGDEMEYSLNAGVWNAVFAVPSSVVDKYIKLASGNALKLLLFLMRHGGKSFGAEMLRAELGFEETGELEDAALFWVQRGVIRAEKRKDVFALSPSEEIELDDKIPAADSKPSEPKKQAVAAAKPAVITNGEIARSINNSPEMKMLFDEAEKMYAHPLRENERQTIAQLTQHYGLTCEVSLMLLGYCFKTGKTSTAYISKVAENWANEEITTVRLADEKIRALERQSSIEQRICEKTGLTSNLSASVRRMIGIWTADWGFGEDMILLAYDKTVDATGKWNASYANKILENWKEHGICTPQAAKKADEEFKKSSAAKKPSVPKRVAATSSKPSFDTDRLKNRVMKNYIKNSQG